VQWAQVQLAPPDAPMGGSGDAPGPTYDACLDKPGAGTVKSKNIPVIKM